MKYLKTMTLIFGITVLSLSSAANAKTKTYFCPGNETAIIWQMTGSHNSPRGMVYNWRGNFTDQNWIGNGGEPGWMSFLTTSPNDPTIESIEADVDAPHHELSCHYHIKEIAQDSLPPYVTQVVPYAQCTVDHNDMSAITCQYQ